jgi:hypothetical protein
LMLCPTFYTFPHIFRRLGAHCQPFGVFDA